MYVPAGTVAQDAAYALLGGRRLTVAQLEDLAWQASNREAFGKHWGPHADPFFQRGFNECAAVGGAHGIGLTFADMDGDMAALARSARNAGAVFQVASQVMHLQHRETRPV